MGFNGISLLDTDKGLGSRQISLMLFWTIQHFWKHKSQQIWHTGPCSSFQANLKPRLFKSLA